jgi:hypothetical protein
MEINTKHNDCGHNSVPTQSFVIVKQDQKNNIVVTKRLCISCFKREETEALDRFFSGAFLKPCYTRNY